MTSAPLPPAGPLPPQMPPPGVRQPGGALAWGLGLLVLLCFPFASSAIAGIAMIIAGLAQRSAGGVAAENGKNAANWGATYLLITLVSVIVFFTFLFGIPDDDPVKQGFFPGGIPLVVLGVVTLIHLVVSVMGLAKGSSGQVFRVPGALPLFRSTS